MTMTTTRLRALVPMFTLGLLACSAAVESDEPHETLETLGTTSEAFSVSQYTWQLPYRGGTGGSYQQAWCGAGDVAIGLYGRSGSMIDAVGFICAKLLSNGTLGVPLTCLGSVDHRLLETRLSEC